MQLFVRKIVHLFIHVFFFWYSKELSQRDGSFEYPQVTTYVLVGIY